MMTSVWILILYSSNNQNFPLQNWNSTKLVDWKEQKGNRCYYHYFNSLLCNTTALLYGSCIAKIHPQLLVPKAFWKIAHNYWWSHAAYFKPILTICRSTIWGLFSLQLPPRPPMTLHKHHLLGPSQPAPIIIIDPVPDIYCMDECGPDQTVMFYVKLKTKKNSLLMVKSSLCNRCSNEPSKANAKEVQSTRRWEEKK